MNPVRVRKGLSGLHQRGVNMAASAHFRVYDRMILKLTIAAPCSLRHRRWKALISPRKTASVKPHCERRRAFARNRCPSACEQA